MHRKAATQIIVGLVIAFVVYKTAMFFFLPVEMTGTSLEPSVPDGARYISERVSLLFSNPKAGDIVIYKQIQDDKSYR